ncbi:hypothetical protein [Okeania sp. KiyG1]|nr:hypothetical protein [Okeania sp. KiyG1]GFZ98382.1 hypothetical protein CYANOKiyG1_09640 [Okeania sp. KiyG1]
MGKNYRQPYPTKIVGIDFAILFSLLIATDIFSILAGNVVDLVVILNVAI